MDIHGASIVHAAVAGEQLEGAVSCSLRVTLHEFQFGEYRRVFELYLD